MAINTKAIKSRIGSVKNTKKITRAMQMIAAVKMRKAVESASLTRYYATLANELLERFQGLEINHPLTTTNKKTEKSLYIVITSNKGLCGSYNTNVLKAAFTNIFADKSYSSFTATKENENVDILAIGNKAAGFAKKFKLGLTSVYDTLSSNLVYESITPISNQVIEDYKNGVYKKVVVVYTNYISGLNQIATTKQLLPISKESLTELLGELGTDSNPLNEKVVESKVDKNLDAYKFEPGKKNVLNYLFPLLVEIQLYQAVLESTASEHSSRMVAMKTATESAGEMIDELTLEFNKGRQAAITQEISEIVSGASTLG